MKGDALMRLRESKRNCLFPLLFPARSYKSKLRRKDAPGKAKSLAKSMKVRCLNYLDFRRRGEYGKSAAAKGRMREMTITLDIRPEVRAELARQASAQGRALEAYAASLLENAVHIPMGSARSQNDISQSSLRELFESVRGLADDVECQGSCASSRHRSLA